MWRASLTPRSLMFLVSPSASLATTATRSSLPRLLLSSGI